MSRGRGAFALLAALLLGAARASARESGPYVSLGLTQALDLALRNNLIYQSAAADEKIAEARVVEAGAGRVPEVAAGYSYVHAQTAASFQIPAATPGGTVFKTIPLSATNMNNVNATLEYAFYSGGAVQAAIGQAAANLAAAQSQYAAAKATVVRDTTKAYFQLIQARQAAVIADEAVSVAQQNVRDTEALLTAGTVAKADLLREQVTLANAQVADVQANNAAALANAALANLLNIDLGSQIEPSEALEITAPDYLLPSVLASAKRRPELAAAADAVTIAEQAIKAARSQTLPTVSLRIQEASSKPNFQNVPQPQFTQALSITWKLFDGGLTRGKLAEAGAQLEKAKIGLAQLENGVDLEVRQAFLNYVAAKAQVGAAETARASADESLRVIRIRFKAGVGTSLELSDALLADTQARNQYVSALAELRIAFANLQRAAAL